MSPVIQRLDSIGRGLESTDGGVEKLRSELAEVKTVMYQLLVAINHIYVTAANPGAPRTLPEFQAYLAPYIGQPVQQPQPPR